MELEFHSELERPTAGPASSCLEAPSRKKPVLRHFARQGPVRIPPLSLTFPLRPPPLQVPAPILKTAVRAEEQEEPMEVDDQVETQGQKKKGGPCSNAGIAPTSRSLETQGNLASLNCSPRTLRRYKGNLTEMNRTDKAKKPRMTIHPKGLGVPSAHSPAGGVLPFWKPDPAPAVLLGPVPSCSHWPDKAASLVLGKDHQPSSSGLPMEWEATQHKDPPALATRSPSTPRAASRSSRQPKWSARQRNPSSCHWSLSSNGVPERIHGRHRQVKQNIIEETEKATWEDHKVTVNCNASPPAPMSPHLLSLPQATYVSQIPTPPPASDLTHVAAGPLILPVPSLLTTPRI
ncbi:hypothetical protein P7K49_027414, partial [Saguinus oedipus]